MSKLSRVACRPVATSWLFQLHIEAADAFMIRRVSGEPPMTMLVGGAEWRDHGLKVSRRVMPSLGALDDFYFGKF